MVVRAVLCGDGQTPPSDTVGTLKPITRKCVIGEECAKKEASGVRM